LTPTILSDLVEAGLLPSAQCTAGDPETEVITMLDVIRNAKLTVA
jgi:hypothetical protein